MSLVRPALATVLVGSLCVAGAASAVTKPKPKPVKPVCNLVTDPSGDASPQTPVPSDDTIDILSADIATNATQITAVLRLKNLSASSVPSQTGVSYEFDFSAPGGSNTLFLAYNADDSGSHSSFGDIESIGGQNNNTSKGPAVTVFDKAKNEVRITAKLSDLSALGKFKPGTKLTGLEAKTWVLIGTPEATPEVDAPALGPVVGPGNGLLDPVDDATGSKNYVIGTPSCIKVGQ